MGGRRSTSARQGCGGAQSHSPQGNYLASEMKSAREVEELEAAEARLKEEMEERQRQIALEEEKRQLEFEKRRAKAAESRERIEKAGCSWYLILGVPHDACLEDVKKAFRELALLHHPDKALDSCNDIFGRIQFAYEQGLRRTTAAPHRISS